MRSPSPGLSLLSSSLQASGVVRIDDVLPPPETRDLRSFIDAELGRAVDAGEAAKDSLFAPVMLSAQRHDLLLSPNDDIVKNSLRSILLGEGCDTDEPHRRPLAALLLSELGPEPELYELACLVSDPGSKRQVSVCT